MVVRKRSQFGIHEPVWNTRCSYQKITSQVTTSLACGSDNFVDSMLRGRGKAFSVSNTRSYQNSFVRKRGCDKSTVVNSYNELKKLNFYKLMR